MTELPIVTDGIKEPSITLTTLNTTTHILSTTTSFLSTTTDLFNTTSSNQSIIFEDEDEGHRYPYYALGFTAASAFIIAVLGTFGNLLTIIALPMTKKLRTTATAFVVNLAVVELLFCIFILPMSGAQYLYLQSHSVSLLTDRDCVFFVSLRYSLTQVELQTILAIALTRALAVATPRLYTWMNKPSIIGCYIAFLWIYSSALRLPAVLEIMGRYAFNPKTMECDLSGASMKARFIYIIIEAIIPVILIFVLYIFVFIMVKLSSNRVAQVSRRGTAGTKAKVVPPPASTSAGSSSGQESGRKGSSSSFKSLKKMISDGSLRARFTRQSSTVSQRLGTSRRDLRVARTIFTIFILVLMCSVPVMMIHIVDRDVTKPTRFLLLHVLYWLQYCLNMVVYVLMNRQYRDAYIDCLAHVFPRFKRHHGWRFFWERGSVSSRQPVNFNSKPGGGASFHPHDSCASEAESGAPNVPAGAATVQPKLNTIPEGHSSSAANDSVFSEPNCKKDSQDAIPPPHKLTGKDSIDEERSSSEEREVEGERTALMDKEYWVDKNGDMGSNSPEPESKV